MSTEPYTGGCACGAIRYHINADPVLMHTCQCRHCQKESGTGHGCHLTFPRAAATLSGAASFWQNTGEGGTVKSRAFCPTCGSPVYMLFPGMPDLIGISAGSLDDPSRFEPQMVMWTTSAPEWDYLAPGLAKFEKMAPR